MEEEKEDDAGEPDEGKVLSLAERFLEWRGIAWRMGYPRNCRDPEIAGERGIFVLRYSHDPVPSGRVPSGRIFRDAWTAEPGFSCSAMASGFSLDACLRNALRYMEDMTGTGSLEELDLFLSSEGFPG